MFDSYQVLLKMSIALSQTLLHKLFCFSPFVMYFSTNFYHFLSFLLVRCQVTLQIQKQGTERIGSIK